MNSEADQKDNVLDKHFLEFVRLYYSSQTTSKLIGEPLENDAKVSTAIFYEKIRTALEYQEEHLILKNAIARIVRRNILLSSNIQAKDLLSRLSTELIWANYLQPNTLHDELWAQIEIIMERYLAMITNLSASYRRRLDAQKLLIDFMASEIEEAINPKKEISVFVNFVLLSLQDYFDRMGVEISDIDDRIQRSISVYSTLFKPDNSYLHFWTLNQIDPKWQNRTTAEYIKIAKNIDYFLQKIEGQMRHPLRTRYTAAFRNVASPYYVLLTALKSQKFDAASITDTPVFFEKYCMTTYETLKKDSRQKVWRGIVRALIFILLSKLTLAFIVEVPVDNALHGEIIWNALIINLSLPPLLMLFAGLTIPNINSKNSLAIHKSIKEILYQTELQVKPFALAKRPRRQSEVIFDYIFSTFTLALVVFVIWLLSTFGFNFVSIFFFFFFVSAVSFLSFRIRVNSKELVVKRRREDTITSFVELIFVPFVRLGKKMSDELTLHNPMLFLLDFLIEAPLKTVIRLIRSWFNFVSKKKEEMEY